MLFDGSRYFWVFSVPFTCLRSMDLPEYYQFSWVLLVFSRTISYSKLYWSSQALLILLSSISLLEDYQLSRVLLAFPNISNSLEFYWSSRALSVSPNSISFFKLRSLSWMLLAFLGVICSWILLVIPSIHRRSMWQSTGSILVPSTYNNGGACQRWGRFHVMVAPNIPLRNVTGGWT